ncbi:hypothetical protein ACFL0L_04145 [Patescibacteria group bacterium]
MSDKNKLTELNQMIETAHASLNAARQVLRDLGVEEAQESSIKEKAKKSGDISTEGDGKVVEGVFDGQNMVGPDGKRYSVPANYASKSKLVEGDMLKLTITADGSFVFKQIGPVERARLVGTLTSDDTSGEYQVLTGNKSYKVLLASVTYFKGVAGDEVVILIPKEGNPTWSAVENIIKENDAQEVPREGVVEATTEEPVQPAAAAVSEEDTIDDIK